MPENTPKLGIPKPLGNETISRDAFSQIYDIIDSNVQKEISKDSNPPSNPNNNDLWVDTNSMPNVLRRYDSMSNSWVNLSPIISSDIGAVENAGNVPSIQEGNDALKPPAGTSGRVYIAKDTQIIYLDTGITWEKIGIANWVDINGKPTQFTPTAHKASHASGGNDPITPEEIGAETPAGAQIKVDTHEGASDPHPQYIQKNGATGFITSYSSYNYVNQWTKIATVTINAQYQKVSFILSILGGSTIDVPTQRGLLFLRVKQQDALGNNPYIQLNLFNSDSLYAEDIKAVATQIDNSVSTIDLYIKITKSYEKLSFQPLHVYSSTGATIEWFEGQPFLTTLPTGTQFNCFYEQAILNKLDVLGQTILDGTDLSPIDTPLIVKGNPDGQGIQIQGGGLKLDDDLALYRGGTGFHILRRYGSDYTILQISAPPTSMGSKEATLSLVIGDEPNVSYIDLYNEEYSSENQFGIRLQKRGNKSYKDFVIDYSDGTTKTEVFRIKPDGTTQQNGPLTLGGRFKLEYNVTQDSLDLTVI